MQLLMQIVARYIKEGGYFYLCDDHPFLNMLPENPLTLTHKYFHTRVEYESDTSYVNSPVRLVNTKNIEWTHSLSDIINAILGAKLQLLWIHEHPFCYWTRFKDMEEDEIGHWLKGELKYHVPLVFSLMVKK